MKNYALVILFILIIFVGGCNKILDKNTNEKNFNALINLLSQKQMISNNATYYSFYTTQSKFDSITNEGKPADDVKKDLKSDLESGYINSNETTDIKKFYLKNNEECFSFEPTYICFDKLGNLLYYARYEYRAFESWKISSLFPYSNDEVQDALSKTIAEVSRKEKIKDCFNNNCKRFFTLLDSQSENEYIVEEEAKLITIRDDGTKYNYKLKYNIKNEQVKNLEIIEGKEGLLGDVRMRSESAVKDVLSKISLVSGNKVKTDFLDVNVICDLSKKQESNLECFDINNCIRLDINEGSNAKFSYCFSNEHLVSAEYGENTNGETYYWKWNKI